MLRPDLPPEPNNPRLFNPLVTNMTQFANTYGIEFGLGGQHDYPRIPNNLAYMAGEIFNFQHAVGRYAMGESAMPDGVHRAVFNYVFTPEYRDAIGRYGELMVCDDIEKRHRPAARRLYWVEKSGIVLEGEPQRLSYAGRRLRDTEVGHLGAIVAGQVTTW